MLKSTLKKVILSGLFAVVTIAGTISTNEASAQRTGYNRSGPMFDLSGSRSTQKTKKAVYVYDLNYAYYTYRGGKRYTVTGRYQSYWSAADANRARVMLSRQHPNVKFYPPRARFWRYTYN